MVLFFKFFSVPVSCSWSFVVVVSITAFYGTKELPSLRSQLSFGPGALSSRDLRLDQDADFGTW